MTTDANVASGSASALKQMQISDEVAVDLVGVNKWYGDFHVLRDINLRVNRGERIVIAGSVVKQRVRVADEGPGPDVCSERDSLVCPARVIAEIA